MEEYLKINYDNYDYDKIECTKISCHCGPIETLVFTDSFEELIPLISYRDYCTSYVNVALFHNEKLLASFQTTMFNWELIKHIRHNINE